MNIIITGASSGIGKGFKEHYEKLGHTVFDISKDGKEPCDITDINALTQVFEKITAKAGQIDMLINCAGFGISGAIELARDEDIRSIFDVNVFGAINCIKLALPHMKAGAKIINISSVMALFPTPYRSYYCATKAALNMISDGLRMELGRSKIQVTSICPSEIKTNFSKNRVKNFETNERYGKSVEASAKGVDEAEEKRMPLDKAIKIMTRWIDSKKLKPLYIMSFKFKLLYRTERLFPKSLYLKACNKAFNKKASY